MDPDSLHDVIVKAEEVFSLDQQDKFNTNEDNPWNISQRDDFGEPHSNIISSEFSESNKVESIEFPKKIRSREKVKPSFSREEII